MKKYLHNGFPLVAALSCALIAFSIPVAAYAQQDAAAAAQATPQSAVSEGAGTFQGLMPPVASDEKAATPAVPVADAADTKADNAKAQADKPPVKYNVDEPSGDDTYPPLMMTPDKAELVRLNADAASVVTGSPENLNIQMETRRLMILTPAKPGATYLTVLDNDGNIIMQRHVIVGSPKTSYIRVRRSCAGQSGSCQETSVYYCDGMCHAVGGSSAMPSASGADSGSGGVASSGAGGGGGGSSPPMTAADAPQAQVNVNPAAAVTPGY